MTFEGWDQGKQDQWRDGGSERPRPSGYPPDPAGPGDTRPRRGVGATSNTRESMNIYLQDGGTLPLSACLFLEQETANFFFLERARW